MNKKAIQGLVAAWKLANNMDDELCKLGYGDTPYFTIAGDIMDGIYHMLEENTSTLEESVAYATLTNRRLTPDQCADAILNAYKQDDSVLSDNVMDIVRHGADTIGVSTGKMIKIIVSEWALRHKIME